jgi:hypothetical protein
MAGLDERDELNEPLGVAPRIKRRPYGGLAIALGAVGLLVGAVYLLQADDPLGGQPYAVAKIERHMVAAPVAAPSSPTASTSADATPVGSTGGSLAAEGASEVEGSSGVKVLRGHSAKAPGSMIIEVPEALGLRLTPAPDRRLVEKSRYGLLPRIGADGARPADVYARPPLLSEKLPAGAPRVALVVSGLGLSESGTMDAIERLPGAVTLAFAPYGPDLERDATRAREAGHETLLQLPMEPFDFPANNPGPHTLLSGAAATENIDNLHWLMTRFAGYVGVMNFLGAKFTADPAALTTVLGDVAARGLLYLDDGTSPRSLARDVAAKLNLRAGGADVVIDADPSPQAIDAALIKLEAQARANGLAIGVAAALPVSVEHVARWAHSLEARGLALIPVSAVVSRGPGPAAQATP